MKTSLIAIALLTLTAGVGCGTTRPHAADSAFSEVASVRDEAVRVEVEGRGRVLAPSAGIDCGADAKSGCRASRGAVGTHASLVAEAAPGWRFSGFERLEAAAQPSWPMNQTGLSEVKVRAVFLPDVSEIATRR